MAVKTRRSFSKFSRADFDYATERRAQKAPWKVIARELGVASHNSLSVRHHMYRKRGFMPVYVPAEAEAKVRAIRENAVGNFTVHGLVEKTGINQRSVYRILQSIGVKAPGRRRLYIQGGTKAELKAKLRAETEHNERRRQEQQQETSP